MREIDLISNRILKQLLDPGEQPKPAKSGREKEQSGLDHTTRPVLMERVAYLRKMARASEGEASETLKQYPRHSIMLSVRLRSGIAELHQNFADLFIVLEGRATLVTGGLVENLRSVGPGEFRGSALSNGSSQELRPGDIAHIAAGTPHQILLSGEAGFAAIVVKLRETGEDDLKRS